MRTNEHSEHATAAPSLRSAAFWVISGWIVATVAGLMIAGTLGGGGTARTASHGGTLAGLSAARPLLGGQQIPVTAASSAVGYNVPLPSTSTASQSNLTATWVVADRGQVALVFDQGKLTIMMQPAIYQDPATEYKTFVAENNVQASVGQVNGQPALVITPGTDVNKSNPAWVEFDLNGVDVNVASEPVMAS